MTLGGFLLEKREGHILFQESDGYLSSLWPEVEHRDQGCCDH